MILATMNIVAGLMFLAVFMLYGFGMIKSQDFAPGAADWIYSYTTGPLFDSRLANVHGNLFALLNILIGYLVLRLPVAAPSAVWMGWRGLAGVLMPLGIVSEIAFGATLVFVLAGGIATEASIA